METDNKRDKLDEELNYWKVDYETKLTENKIHSIKSCIDTFSDFLKSKDFIIQYNDLVCLASSVDCEIKIYPQFDYKKEPRQARRVKITKRDFVNKKKTEFLIGIFNNTPLPEPDLKRLLENPYKGLSTADIELLEKKKNLKYYKEYISEPETNESTEYNAVNLTTQRDLGIGKNILKFLEMILE
jgi:hypothetical protein